MPLYDARVRRHFRGAAPGWQFPRCKIAAMIQVQINGESLALPPATTVAALLESRGLVGKRVAVERNGEIVPKSRHAETALAAGDRIEIVVAVGGG